MANQNLNRLDLISLETENAGILCNGVANKDARHRLSRFALYLAHHHLQWWQPDLAGYAEAMRQQGYSEVSIRAHLSSIRARYRTILRQRDLFYGLVSQLEVVGVADQKAIVDELVARIEAAIDPDQARAYVTTYQDISDRQRLWLTGPEVEVLLECPTLVHGDVPVAWRDTAILEVFVSTGIRESELAALVVDDLYQTIDGELCLLVRAGKGNKQRAIPYGDMEQTVLTILERWLGYLWDCGVRDRYAPVFWSFWKDNRTLRGQLSVRRIIDIVKSYPFWRNGQLLSITPHDLRRTYARLQYNAGLSLLSISQNLGHTSIEVTRDYIGQLDMAQRRNRKAI